VDPRTASSGEGDLREKKPGMLGESSRKKRHSSYIPLRGGGRKRPKDTPPERPIWRQGCLEKEESEGRQATDYKGEGEVFSLLKLDAANASGRSKLRKGKLERNAPNQG